MKGPVWPDLLTVRVTAWDIEHGMPQAIARAAQRVLGVPVAADAEAICALGADMETLARWHIPQSVRDSISRSGSGEPVEPFTFTAERTQ